jgi:hypothetical protein
MTVKEKFNGRGTEYYVTRSSANMADIGMMAVEVARKTGCKITEVLFTPGRYIKASFTVYPKKGEA